MKHAFVVGALTAAVVSTAQTAVSGDPAAVALPEPARQRELLTLLRQDCGSCHGLRLTGGLGPALTAEAMKARPAEGMVATIHNGRPGTAMPPWSKFLSEGEARWLVGRMQDGNVDPAR